MAMKADLSIDMDDFRSKATKCAVCYVSMPNNPTGYMSAQQLRDMVKIMADNEGAVVWDAPYLLTLVRLDGHKASFDARLLQETLNELRELGEEYHPHLCVLSSLSKSCLIAGLRFGFAYGSTQWIDNMEAIVGRENLSSPTPSFIAGREVLQAVPRPAEELRVGVQGAGQPAEHTYRRAGRTSCSCRATDSSAHCTHW